jgi:hypothetical protein
MERLGPDMLREYADALEDKRHLENVESCRRCPELDQHMLLALNGATSKRSEYKGMLPNAGTIIKGLSERIIEVSASGNQSAILGIFYTNIDPMERRPRVMAGIFPLYPNKVDYLIRPQDIDLDYWQSNGMTWLKQESVREDDPLQVFNPKGPNFLFFRKSPFEPNHPYQTILPSKKKKDIYLPEAKPLELALEENVIRRALWTLSVGRKPKLFRQTGFARFINSHCSEPQYIKLHAAFTQSRFRK